MQTMTELEDLYDCFVNLGLSSVHLSCLISVKLMEQDTA